MIYAIRHKETGNYLSQYWKGGSYWNGENDGKEAHRIFTLRAAKSFVSQWAMGEHKQTYEEYDTLEGRDGRSYHFIKDVGRKRTDLEIIPITISYGEPV